METSSSSLLFCKTSHTSSRIRTLFLPKTQLAQVSRALAVQFNPSAVLWGRSSAPPGQLMKVLCNNRAPKRSSAAAFDSASEKYVAQRADRQASSSCALNDACNANYLPNADTRLLMARHRRKVVSQSTA